MLDVATRQTRVTPRHVLGPLEYRLRYTIVIFFYNLDKAVISVRIYNHEMPG